MYADWTDRIARRRAARPARRRARRATSATSSSRCGTGPIRRSICTTRSRATSAIRPSTRTARSTARSRRAPTTSRSIDPKTNTRQQIKLQPCAIRRRRAKRTRRRPRRRRTGATKRSGTARPTRTASRWTSRPRLDRGAHPSERRPPRSAAGGSDHPSAKAVPDHSERPPDADVRSEDEEVTTIDTCFGTHHLNFDDNDVLWFTRRRAVEGWFDTTIWDKTHDEKKAQGWTRVRSRHQRQRQARRVRRARISRSIRPRTSGSTPVLRRRARVRTASIWGSVQGMPGALVRLVARAESAGNGAVGDTTRCRGTIRRLGSGLRAARHGRRQQRRRLDGALERPARELRSPQVQGDR